MSTVDLLLLGLLGLAVAAFIIGAAVLVDAVIEHRARRRDRRQS